VTVEGEKERRGKRELEKRVMKNFYIIRFLEGGAR